MDYGHYRLDGLLGAGGFGQVFRAYNTRSNKPPHAVALKILPSEAAGDSEFRERFLRECEIISALSAPHIVAVNNFGETDGKLFLEMDLLEGLDLGRLLATSQKLTVVRSLQIVQHVASALDVAHTAGLIHRDVKPGNIFITTARDGSDFAYLIDFGIARQQFVPKEQQITRTGGWLGTLAYMAPEMFQGRGDGRADVYSLACVLYECLTGRPPFECDSLAQFMHAHLEVIPEPVNLLFSDIPTCLARVIARGLEKNPDFRFDTAGGFVQAAWASVADVPLPRTNREVFILNYNNGNARIWDLRGKRFVGERFEESSGDSQAPEKFATAELDGRTIVVSGSTTEAWTWDMRSGEPLGPSFDSSRTTLGFDPRDTVYFWAVTTALLRGDLVVISAYDTREQVENELEAVTRFFVWNPVSKEILSTFKYVGIGVRDMITVAINGEPTLLVGGSSMVRVPRVFYPVNCTQCVLIDLKTGSPVRRLAPLILPDGLYGFTSLGSLALVTYRGSSCIICNEDGGGDFASSALLDLTSGTPIHYFRHQDESPGYPPSYRPEVPASRPGPLVVQKIVSINDRAILLRYRADKRAGTPIEVIDLEANALLHASRPVRAYDVTLSSLNGELIACATHGDESDPWGPLVWNLETGATLAKFDNKGPKGLRLWHPATLTL